MLDTTKIDPKIKEAIAKNLGIKPVSIDEIIRDVTPEQAFACYCNWHGLVGWGPDLVRAIDNLRAAVVESEANEAPSGEYNVVAAPDGWLNPEFFRIYLNGFDAMGWEFIGSVGTVAEKPLLVFRRIEGRDRQDDKKVTP